jgi:hypothetical protein
MTKLRSSVALTAILGVSTLSNALLRMTTASNCQQ